MTNIRTYWELEVRDKTGKVTYRRKFKAHSYLKQHIHILKTIHNQGNFETARQTSVTDVTNTGRLLPQYSGSLIYNPMALYAPAATSAYGLVVGSNNAPNVVGQYALGAQIAHGTGSGQLSHGATTCEEIVNPSGLLWQFRIIRTFTNGSGASIGVNEIGLYVGTGTQTWYFCVARDVLPSTVTVPNGSTLTVRYIQQLTVA